MSEIKSNADIEPCLSVVMPVYNEAATVAEVIKVVLLQRPVQQLVVVDDASTDGTWEKLKLATNGDARVTLVRHEQNQGKGAALRTGFARARRMWCLARGFWAPGRIACCITGTRWATTS